MAVSVDFVAYVVEQLAPFARVTSRRMFGGVGLYADGLFFAIMDGDALYFKVDDSNRSDYEQRGCKPFCPFPDKPEMSMNYYDVPADLLDDAEELCRWARKSVAVALVAANKKVQASTKKKAKVAVKKAKRSAKKASRVSGKNPRSRK